ncbi:hypothetical protein JQ609_10055 [Bradyrhizobium sp. AUGA SZCCT0169]|uniref:hypothetical protein n=1 Tax=Bradyrhizobium sp. AUGA SZCCT0169 TaxID=2807663 RepID=UPI001BA68F9A|nr:hypothetical protein [Bradyrhizobium sp. AUGA SZCCT0169]MBR1247277.1 hypothetical protein [Bradyrhizobium sp. AUGA SZCCT0169]
MRGDVDIAVCLLLISLLLMSRVGHRAACTSQIGEAVVTCDHSVSTAPCEAIHTRVPAPALTTAHDNTAESILVVQARCLGTLPRKVPVAPAQLTRVEVASDPSLSGNSDEYFIEAASANCR